MAFRSPSASSNNIKSVVDTATSGTANYLFNIPQDADSIVARVYAGAFTGTSPTADVYIQTSEDGGTTWRDVAHFKQITGTVVLQNAEFQPIACIGGGSSRGLANWVGSVAASTLAAANVSGLPMLGTLGRVFIVYGGTQLANAGINVDVFAPTAQVK